MRSPEGGTETTNLTVSHGARQTQVKARLLARTPTRMSSQINPNVHPCRTVRRIVGS